jgi:hypothetical protein
MMSFKVKDLIVNIAPQGIAFADPCGGCSGSCTGTGCPAGCSNGDTGGCTANTSSARCDPTQNRENPIIDPPQELLEMRALLRYALARVNQQIYPVREPQTIAEADLVEQQLRQALENLSEIRNNLQP